MRMTDDKSIGREGEKELARTSAVSERVLSFSVGSATVAPGSAVARKVCLQAEAVQRNVRLRASPGPSELTCWR